MRYAGLAAGAAVCGPGRGGHCHGFNGTSFGWIAAFTGAPAISTAACTKADMAFGCILLRPGDTFADIEPNVGQIHSCWHSARWVPALWL